MAAEHNIIITGGASGIGLAIAEAVVAQGWRAIVADVDRANLDQARARFAERASPAHFFQLDVTDEDAVRQLIARCDEEIGALTGLVNSAGIGADVHCLETSTALFRKFLEVNLIGNFVVAREAARQMRQRGRGSIVNIASVSGIRANSGRVAYGASKAGLLLATQVMAVELAPLGIRVNAIAPGPIETPLVRQMHTDEARVKWTDAVPQHRYGSPADVAAAAMFLLDDSRSSFVTGQTLCVDGGFTVAGMVQS
ncbi:MAG TPA: SDR family oxidoreductase [Pirellulales bacterium]|nr:SDR family oxidoreductase [Pirellulales bacterium]